MLFLVGEQHQVVVLVFLSTLLTNTHVLWSILVAFQVSLELGKEGRDLLVAFGDQIALGVSEVHACAQDLAVFPGCVIHAFFDLLQNVLSASVSLLFVSEYGVTVECWLKCYLCCFFWFLFGHRDSLFLLE